MGQTMPRTGHEGNVANKCKYKCIYTNLDGISNKVAEFSVMINNEKPDFVFLTETKLNADFLNVNIFDTKVYNVFKRDRPNQAAPGGGVTILVNKSLLCSEVTLLNSRDAWEMMWCEVKCSEVNIILGVIYRTPSSSVENNLKICDILRLSEDFSGNKQILVCGDFNLGNIVWEENLVIRGSSNYNEANQFLETINENFWQQNVFEWTHLRDTENLSRLDLVFTKKDCEVDSMKCLPPLGLSKQCILSFEFMSESRAELHFDNFKRRNFFKTDLDKLFKFISEADLMTRLQNKSTAEKWKIFREVYDKAIELCVPLHKPKSSSNKKPKWLNSPRKEN